MENMPIISQLPCTSGSSLPSLFQPEASQGHQHRMGQGGGFVFMLGGQSWPWARRGLVLGCAESHPDLSQCPLCTTPSPHSTGTAWVAEPDCAWQELLLLFALGEIKTNGAFAIATFPPGHVTVQDLLTQHPAVSLRGGNALCVRRSR